MTRDSRNALLGALAWLVAVTVGGLLLSGCQAGPVRPVSTVEYTFTSDDVADDVDEGRYTSHDVSAATGFRLPLTDAEENVEAIIDLLFGVGTFFDEDNYEQNSQLLRISPSMTIPLGESQGSIYLNLDQSWWINDNTHHTYLNVYWEKEW